MAILQYGPDVLTIITPVANDDGDQIVSWTLPESFVIAYLRVGIAGNVVALRAACDCAWGSKVPANQAEFDSFTRRPFGRHSVPLGLSVEIMKLDADANMVSYPPRLPIFSRAIAGANVFSVLLFQDGNTTEAMFASIEPLMGCEWVTQLNKQSITPRLTSVGF